MVTCIAISQDTIGYGCWGRGHSVAKATAALRKAGGKTSGKWMLYAIEHKPEQVLPYVDDMGSVCFHGEIIKKEGREGTKVVQNFLA